MIVSFALRTYRPVNQDGAEALQYKGPPACWLDPANSQSTKTHDINQLLYIQSSIS